MQLRNLILTAPVATANWLMTVVNCNPRQYQHSVMLYVKGICLLGLQQG